MCARQNANPSFLDKFRDLLLDLPVAKKAPHAIFFTKMKMISSWQSVMILVATLFAYIMSGHLENYGRVWCIVVLAHSGAQLALQFR